MNINRRILTRCRVHVVIRVVRMKGIIDVDIVVGVGVDVGVERVDVR